MCCDARCLIKVESIQSTDKCQHPYLETVNKVKEIVLKMLINPLIHNDTIHSLMSDSKDLKKVL